MTSEQKKRLFKAKIAVALHLEGLGRSKKRLLVDLSFLLFSCLLVSIHPVTEKGDLLGNVLCYRKKSRMKRLIRRNLLL